MNKKISLGAAIAYMAIVAAVAFSLTMIFSMNLFNVKMTDITEREKMYSSLSEVDLYVRENYYGTIDENALQEAIAQGYMSGINDPNARYFTTEEYETYTQSSSGKYIGVGVVTELDSSGYIYVKEVYPDSPAQLAGIRAGALITSVDGTRAQSSNYEKLSGRLRGDAGTKVTIVVRQDSEDNTLELTLRVIDVPTVKSTVSDNHIAYISFAEISSTTSDQLKATLDSVTEQGALGIVLDLRGINSSEFSYVSSMLDQLLPAGTLAYSKDKDGNLTKLTSSDANYNDIPAVILADETTSGTAELFVQAMQDFGRAKVIGTNTAGDGDICEIIKLSDGSAIRVTTAQYAGPGKTTFEETGVTPDYEVALSAGEGDRTNLLGNAELDAPYKKALEVLGAALK